MSKSNTFENDLLKLILTGAAITGLAQDHDTPLDDLYISLHTADPGETGAQNTSEIGYDGYERVAIARSAGEWTITDNQAVNTNDITFPESSDGPFTAAWFAVGTDATGAGKILYRGQVTSPSGGLVINAAITPRFPAEALAITED